MTIQRGALIVPEAAQVPDTKPGLAEFQIKILLQKQLHRPSKWKKKKMKMWKQWDFGLQLYHFSPMLDSTVR